MGSRERDAIGAATTGSAAVGLDAFPVAVASASEPVGHWTIEFDTGSITWSEEMFAILDVDPRSTVPAEQIIVERTHREDRGPLRCLLEGAAGTPGPRLLRHRIVTRQGVRHVEALSARVFDDTGALHCAWGTLRDITERVRREYRLTDFLCRYRELIERSRDSILVLDLAGRVLEANDAYLERSGYAREQLSGRPVWRLDAGFAEAGALEQIRKIVDLGTLHFETQGLDARGRSWPAEVVASYSPADGGRVICLIRDISALRDAERSTRDNARRFRALLETTRDGLLVLDRAGFVVEANDAYARFSGYGQGELMGKHISDLDAEGGEARARRRCEEIMQLGSALFEREHRRADGSLWPVEVSASFADVEGGRIFSLFRDISDRRRAEERLHFLAFNDALTGLPNRRLLSDRLEQAMRVARRDRESVGVAYLDLDRFKSINDRFGHDVGDALLVELSDRLRAALRPGDTVARLGGDEFVLLLTALGGHEEAEEIAGRLLAGIAQPFDVDGRRLYLSASVGITLFPDDDEDAETLLRHADHALYQAKEGAQGTYRFFDRVAGQRALLRKEALQRLERGLADGEFCLHFQPRVNLRTGEVVAVEALARWDHPERGLLHPAEFLPLLAQSSLELAFDEWVFEQALRERGKMAGAGLEIGVSVNVSPRYIQHQQFPAFLASLLSRFPGDAARWLEIEVLETSAIGSTKRVASIMEACCALGVRFSLDDFGTGYSSLTYFHRLPISILKIDRNFIRDLLVDPGDHAIVDGILRLASAIGKPVVAEGVETAEVASALLSLGCELAQGYGIARPMPAAEVPGWARRWRARFP